MRKIKFLLAMSLLVFVFSGCGGSAGDGDDSDSDATLHEQISELLTGQWLAYSNSVRSTPTVAATTIRLSSFGNFNLSISDVNFASDSDNSAGTAKVYYSLLCSVYTFGGNFLENLAIRSYTSSSTSIYKEMILTPTSATEWVLQDPDSSTKITLTFTSLSEGTSMQAVITGSETLSSTNTQYNYTITCNSFKKNATALEDSAPESEGADAEKIANILTGTWKFSEGDESGSATASSNFDRDSADVTLELATNVYLIISDVDLEPEGNTTSLTGTAKVVYNHQWTARDETGAMVGDVGGFQFARTSGQDAMKLIHVRDNIWRLEDITTGNEHIVITVESETELSTIWAGVTSIVGNIGNTYNYSITCSFRKQ
ncbi:MAG: hypothetical protein IJ859_10165 [Synergistaceae bacterium]|nr:hypothetical protein [Synergistaceae bacterium]